MTTIPKSYLPIPLLEGKIYIFYPFLPYLWPCAGAALSSSACYSTDEQLFMLNSFYPVTWLTMKMNSCYWEQLINWWPSALVHNFLLRHHAYLNIAQIIWVYSTLTHREVWRAIFTIPYESVHTVTQLNCLHLVDFLPATFATFPTPEVVVFFCRLFFHIFQLFLWY